MGNCCGKADGNFDGEGRVLGSTDDTPYRSVQTKPQRSAARGPGRTLGQTSDSGLAPGEAAAQAAEVRIKKAPSKKRRGANSRMARAKASGGNKGALGQKLNAQKTQSQSTTLAQSARDNLAARDADAAAQQRAYN